jgi:hypothetical protein
MICLLALVVLTACGRPDTGAPRINEPRIEPSVTTPGIHYSGYATIGVKGRF